MRGRPGSRRVCHQLWANLSDVYERSQRPQRLLALVVDAIPELQFVQNELYRRPVHVPRALGMILIVITARLRSAEARDAPVRGATGAP